MATSPEDWARRLAAANGIDKLREMVEYYEKHGDVGGPGLAQAGRAYLDALKVIGHPDLAPGTKLYSVRVEKNIAAFMRWEVVGPVPDAERVTVLRDLAEDSDETVRVQTNGREIYDAVGWYYSTDSMVCLNQYIGLTQVQQAKARKQALDADSLLTQLLVMRDHVRMSRPKEERC